MHRTQCYALALATGLAAAVPAAHADGPAYPFDIRRTIAVGEPLVAVKGQVFYAETSAGREATFLVDPLPPGDWPVEVGADDELTRLTFKKRGDLFTKDEEIVVFCAAKFGKERLHNRSVKMRATLCLRDSDGDGAFDQAYEGLSMLPKSGFDDQRFSFWGLMLSDKPKEIAPLRMTKRRIMPDEGKEGVVELRYNGVKGGKPSISISARTMDIAKPVFETAIELSVPVPGTAVDAVIEHPVLGSPNYRKALGYDRPPPPPPPPGAPAPQINPPKPIPTMTLSIQAADAKGMTGKIVTAFPEWVWYVLRCIPIELPKSQPDQSVPQPPRTPVPCERMTWRQDKSLITIGPATPGQGNVETSVTSIPSKN